MKNLGAILTLCLAYAINPALEVSPFPYIAECVLHTLQHHLKLISKIVLLSVGVSKHNVSTYSGLAESMMGLASFLSTPLVSETLNLQGRNHLVLLVGQNH